MSFYSIAPYVWYDFYSNMGSGVYTVSSVAADKALPTITIPSNPGVTIVKAFLDIYHMFERNTNAANNATTGQQFIQIDVAGGGYNDALELPNNVYYAEALGTTQNPLVKGNIDISSLIDWGDTLNIKWEQAASVRDSLQFYNPQVYLRILGRLW